MDEVSTLVKMHKLEHKAPEIRWGATFQKIIVVASFFVCPYVPGSKYTHSPLAGSFPGSDFATFPVSSRRSCVVMSMSVVSIPSHKVRLIWASVFIHSA